MKKFMILFIAGVLGAAMLAGCKGGDEGTTGGDSASAPVVTPMASSPASAPMDASAPASSPMATAPASSPMSKGK